MGKFFMKTIQGYAARCRRRLRIVEIFAPYDLSILGYAAFPFLVMVAPTDAFEAGLVILLNWTVSTVFAMCCMSNVADAVVRSNPIFVVEFIRRPFAVYVKPNQAMALIEAIVDSNLDISIRDASRRLSGMAGIPGTAALGIFPPSEDPGFLIQIKNGAQFLRSESGFFLQRVHDEFLSFWSTRDDVARVMAVNNSKELCYGNR